MKAQNEMKLRPCKKIEKASFLHLPYIPHHRLSTTKSLDFALLCDLSAILHVIPKQRSFENVK